MTRRRDLLLAMAAAPGTALAVAMGAPAQPDAPGSSAQRVQFGRLDRWAPFPSRAVPARPVEVWLPPGYDGRRPHAVVYMHDGQMLFDASTTWNKQAWAVDRVAAPLLAAGALRDFIVVGIWNRPEQRHSEYFPQAFLPMLQGSAVAERYLRGQVKFSPSSDAYLRFIVEELKPAIDARYATDPTPESTFLMGASMGGLVSLYGLCEYPRVFGAAAALSTHWIGVYERNDDIPGAALAYLKAKLPAAGRLKLYMDRGTADLDALYDQAQQRVDALMASLGHAAPQVVSRVFQGQGHNEVAWSSRLEQPLRFLLGKGA